MSKGRVDSSLKVHGKCRKTEYGIFKPVFLYQLQAGQVKSHSLLS